MTVEAVPTCPRCGGKHPEKFDTAYDDDYDEEE
jgi:hypothetical protein